MRPSPDSAGAPPPGRQRQWMRALALALAIVVWIVIREAISQEAIVFDVPVTFVHEPGFAVLERSVDTVDIRFRGSRSDLSGLKPSDLTVSVDVRNLGESRSRETIDLRPFMVRAPGGARAVSLTPAEIVISMDREGELDIPVRAELQDKPPEGFAVERFVCEPAAVRLRGPLSKLQEVESLVTAPIGLEGRTRSFKTRVSVLPPSGLPLARIEPERVQVEVVIAEHSATRVFERVPVRLMSKSGAPGLGRVQMAPMAVTITLQGREAILKDLTPEQILLFVDCSGVSAAGGATYELPVQWVLPAGVRAVSAEPATVRLGETAR